MNNPNLLGLLTAPTTVGSGDLLGCWYFKLATIAALFCFGMALVGELREEFKKYKRRREYKNTYCKINKDAIRALGTLGDQNVQGCPRKMKIMVCWRAIVKKTANLITGGAQKPRLPFRLNAAFRNFFRCFSFHAHKSKSVAKQPNV
jgi:hypothetical protein